MKDEYESLLLSRRNFVARYPSNKKVVLIISGGLDSVVMAARLIEEEDITVYPLHIQRGQGNTDAERASLDFFATYYQKRYGDKFRKIAFTKLNVPPSEFRSNLVPYTKENGHPLRDTVLQLAAVQYAISLKTKEGDIETVFCAVMPEDYFPHSSLESIRATNVAACQNLNNWNWVLSSPNIDPFLSKRPIDKPSEIKWALKHNIPIHKSVSCNDASKDTDLLNCGVCSSCKRRKLSFEAAGIVDKTEYFNQ